jgi:hypothetical protein
MTSSLDDIRAAFPHLGLALYAMEPGQPVTLEIHTPDGKMFTIRAKTEAAAIAKAFPPDDPEQIPPEAEPIDIFD